MRINQIAYPDGYGSTNLIEQSKTSLITRFIYFLCSIVRHRQMQIRIAAANISNPNGKNTNTRFTQ